MIQKTFRHGHRAVTRGIVNAIGRFEDRPAADFVAEDWDVLVLLDACRTDYYRRHTKFGGTPETRWSPGSASEEWMRATFTGRQLHDTVYVTPNPHVSMLDDGIFHYVEDCRDAWEEGVQTVRPETMTATARDVAREFPNKRLVVHYMQPHTPYLGPTAEQIRERTAIAGWKTDHVSDGIPEDRDRPSVWDLALDGRIEWDDVRRAYAETLDLALEAVEDLVDALDGRIVISADHGELLGERLVPGGPREWAHPAGLAAPPLRRVPWHVVQDADRPEIVSEPPIEREGLSDEEIHDRLAALGYAEE